MFPPTTHSEMLAQNKLCQREILVHQRDSGCGFCCSLTGARPLAKGPWRRAKQRLVSTVPLSVHPSVHLSLPSAGEHAFGALRVRHGHAAPGHEWRGRQAAMLRVGRGGCKPAPLPGKAFTPSHAAQGR